MAGRKGANTTRFSEQTPTAAELKLSPCSEGSWHRCRASPQQNKARCRAVGSDSLSSHRETSSVWGIGQLQTMAPATSHLPDGGSQSSPSPFPSSSLFQRGVGNSSIPQFFIALRRLVPKAQTAGLNAGHRVRTRCCCSLFSAASMLWAEIWDLETRLPTATTPPRAPRGPYLCSAPSGCGG